MAEGPPDEKTEPRFGYTGAGYWGGAWYPYWSLMLISVLGGFFGLDHFWLRSPVTGIIKCLVNLFCFGGWWIYDILQVFGYKDRVLKTGLSMPYFGAQGIGAGVFKDLPGVEGDAKAPWRWIGYLLLSFMPFGIDSFIGGDSKGGLAKFVYTLIPIMWPLLILWKCVDVYRAFITPKAVWEDGMYRFFPVNLMLGTYYPTTLGPVDPLPKPESGSVIGTLLQPVVDTVIVPVKAVSNAATAAAGTFEAAADGATELIHAATETATPIVKTASSVVQMAPTAVKAVPTIVQDTTSKLSSLTSPQGLKALASKQVPGGMHGGGLSNEFDSMAVAGVALFILVGGVCMGALRVKEILSKNHGTTARDDRPPEAQ